MAATRNHLLVLEADPTLRRTLVSLADAEGLSVAAVADLDAARTAASDVPPDGIICGTAAEQLCREIRSVYPHAVVIRIADTPPDPAEDRWWDLAVARSHDPVDVVWHMTNLLASRVDRRRD